MDKVYITGHRNPDTDSIVSAMAYGDPDGEIRGLIRQHRTIAASAFAGHFSPNALAELCGAA